MTLGDEIDRLIEADVPPPPPPVADVLPRISVQIVPPTEVGPVTAHWGAERQLVVFAYDYYGSAVEIDGVRWRVGEAEELAVRILSAVHWHRARAESTKDGEQRG